MTAREAVDKAKKVSSASEDVLFDACRRLEIEIEKYAGREHAEFEKDGVLLAAGGAVAKGYDKMYTAYLKGEGALSMEDWDCYNNYNAIFAIEWEKLAKEIVRKRESAKSTFTPDWRWN